MASMTAVSSMHEHMHAHAGQEKCPEKPVAPQDVNAMLVSEEEANNHEPDDEISSGSRPPE